MSLHDSPVRTLKRVLAAAIIGLPLASCGGGSDAVVSPPPPPPVALSLNPATAAFSYTAGAANPAPDSIAVMSSGAAISGLGIGTITYGAGASGWLAATIGGASTPATLILSASPAALAPGSYAATVPVTSSTAGIATQNIQVTLSVGQAAGASVLIAGNIAQCGTTGDEATALLLDSLPGTVFTAGDNAFPQGSAANYHDCYDPSWGRFKSRTWATLGNHEYDQGNATDAFSYFGDHAGPAGKGYYSMNVGSWHIIVLNDNRTFVEFMPGSEQSRWLRADLAADTSRCTMAIWHQPLFYSSTSGVTQGSDRKALWDTLYAYNADVIINGHQHHYERLAPMNPSGARDDARGMREFNSGLGGASALRPTTVHPYSESIGTTFGILKLTLRQGGYDWKFIPIAGETFSDSGSGTCH